MCGICGISDLGGQLNINREIISRMCSVIRHRGPDDEGYFIDNRVGIGMTRLSIIDVQGGHQPIHNEDKSIWIVFNGEIYNFLELKEELTRKGHQFYTSSDTEVIIHLYEEYHHNCLDHMCGMFAFAIWDQREQKLFLARDRLGIKPLYYYNDGGFFAFGSEIKSILQIPWLHKVVDPIQITNFLAYNYIPGPFTIFKNINKLEAAHYLEVKTGGIFLKKYWDYLRPQSIKKKERYYEDRIYELLMESVKKRMISDVPLGAFLSGGIDSSAVVALMSKISSIPVKTFSIGFEEKDYCELEHARTIARMFNTDHHEEIIKPDMIDILPKLARHFDEPFGDSSAIPTYYLAEFTRKYVTVALGGDGGDELFGGYERYVGIKKDRYFAMLPYFIRKILLTCSKSDGLFFRINDILKRSFMNEKERFIYRNTVSDSDMLNGLLSKEMKSQIGGIVEPHRLFDPIFNNASDHNWLTRLTYVDIKTYLPEDILMKIDKTSMACSLEVRVPFLDHHLVEFVSSIPDNFKINGFKTKYILKKAVSGILPSQIIHRKKQGFRIPLTYWFRGELKSYVHSIILSPRALSRGYFDTKKLNEIFNLHIQNKRDFGLLIFSLIMLELWHQEFIDSK